MITQDLFKKILLTPVSLGANALYVVSGYASPSMAYKHLEAIPANVVIKLIIGMASNDGILKARHHEFVKLASKDYNGRFECWYNTRIPSVHSKVYAWFREDQPKEGFTGSANYTQPAFFKQGEALAEDSAEEILNYFKSLLPQSINCLDPKVEQAVQLLDVERRHRPRKGRQIIPVVAEPILPILTPENAVSIDLLEGKKELGGRSGLNWGQRPGREPNQAYIPVPSKIARQRFFPERGRHFTLITDDGQSFDAVVAQDNNKAIETPLDNSLLGRYFRKRLGLKPGELVRGVHLKRYGRSSIDFSKIDDETYYLDFSV